MDKEQIENEAALRYGSRDKTIGNFWMSCFIQGAEWRINSVWHDVSEEPDINRTILYFYGAGMPVILHYRQTTKRWNEIIKGISIYRWAYLDDLTPERKEEEK